ncbi:hypothetical protein C0989_007884 [Termitomyces sp. Mn162]|nr:hypothetical protein C0989_007884 [Termitomyces sp. Mn162]
MLSRVFLTFLTALFVTGAVSTPAVMPFVTQASVAIVQNPDGDGDSRIYSQPSSLGAIVEYASTTIPFAIRDRRILVPANETHQATPIVATILGPSFKEESPFFVS